MAFTAKWIVYLQLCHFQTRKNNEKKSYIVLTMFLWKQCLMCHRHFKDLAATSGPHENLGRKSRKIIAASIIEKLLYMATAPCYQGKYYIDRYLASSVNLTSLSDKIWNINNTRTKHWVWMIKQASIYFKAIMKLAPKCPCAVRHAFLQLNIHKEAHSLRQTLSIRKDRKY